MLQIVKVTGNSLSPEYQDGDFVLVVKIPIFLRSIHPGDTIVFYQIAYGEMIKHVDHLDDQGELIYVRGLHPDSMDSRQFGPISKRDVVGKVIWHIRNKRSD